MKIDSKIIQKDLGLSRFLKALSQEKISVRVGVLGGKASRSTRKGESNAGIGAVHEFGNATHPRRSFLLDPLQKHLKDSLQRTGQFTDADLKSVLSSGCLAVWGKKLGVAAVAVILEAFSTRGFGTWSPWKKGYTNNTGDVLVDTQQLRNSITYDVKG